LRFLNQGAVEGRAANALHREQIGAANRVEQADPHTVEQPFHILRGGDQHIVLGRGEQTMAIPNLSASPRPTVPLESLLGGLVHQPKHGCGGERRHGGHGRQHLEMLRHLAQKQAKEAACYAPPPAASSVKRPSSICSRRPAASK